MNWRTKFRRPRPDLSFPYASEHTVDSLPDEALVFLLPSRYCETELLAPTAWSLFGGMMPGWSRVQAICDFVHQHIAFDYQCARPTKTAWETYNERKGVCRDYAHLAITLCRCLNIPARYISIYNRRLRSKAGALMNVGTYMVEKLNVPVSRGMSPVSIACASLALLCAALSVAPATAAPATAPATVVGFSYVKSLSGIDEYRLDSNGLTVLLVPDHSAPVVTFQVTYQVGSRNEVTGTTGATHILEHMMFKGSEGFNDPKGNSVKQFLERVGGQFNASTSFDRTNYFATVGRESLEGYIAIEADRMRHLWLHEADRQSEMTVVRNEYERGKNDPDNVLMEEVTEAAYVALPYHHPTIGWKSDIEHVPITKLRDFYDTFYWPNNATVTVIGDIEPAATLGLIKKYYGVYPHSPAAIPEIYTEEPAQSGERRVIVRRPGELGTVIIAHKVPNGRDADQPALDMMDAILSSGKNARLYRALVDQGIALNAGAGTDLHRDLSLHTVYAVLAPGATHDQIEKALQAEITKIATDGVTAAEVARVKQQYIAADAYKRDGTAAIAGEINEWIAVGDWTLYVTFPQKVQLVTPADVQRVAKEYFKQDQSTTGWFIPVLPAAEKGT